MKIRVDGLWYGTKKGTGKKCHFEERGEGMKRFSIISWSIAGIGKTVRIEKYLKNLIKSHY